MARLRRMFGRLILFALIVILAGAAASWLSRPRLPSEFVVELSLSGPLREAPGGRSLGLLDVERRCLYDIGRGLRHAASDARVRGVLLRFTSLQTGWSAARELRRAVEAVRHGGKPVVVLLEAAGDKEFMVASAADSVFLIPAGHMLLDGLAAEVGFWKGTLDKVGLEAQMERIGDYKSAPETYTRTGMSREFRASLDALLDDVFGAYLSDVTESRDIDPRQMRALLEDGPYGARAALENGIIDGLKYRADVLDGFGVGDKEVVDMERYLDAIGDSKGAKIAYVVVEGAITPGRSTDLPFTEPSAGSESVAEALQHARADESFKGVLVRVNSPGGSAMASDVIWDEVRRTAAVKPVVVSMGDVAASGGYYVSMPATRIVAEATTITGSIGVYAGKLVAEDLYDKIGYRVETLTRGSHADLFSEARSFSGEERESLHEMLWDFYWNAFVAKAAEGRGMSRDRVDSLGRGRVWSGQRALEGKLIDGVGGIWAAQDTLAALLNLPSDTPVDLVPVPRPKPLLARIVDLLLAEDRGVDLVSRLGEPAGVPSEPGLFTRMPCRVEIE